MRKAKPKQVRGDRLVDKVVKAALEELSGKGYDGFSIEEVAERAAVNKTTVYRRWPTKAALARAALERTADAVVVADDTGTVRGDLVRFLRRFRDFVTSARGQTLMRMMLADDPEVARLAQSLREAKECVPRELIERAVARGELPRGTDGQLVFDVLVASLQHQVLFVRGKCSDRWIAKLVDLVIGGAEKVGPKRRPKSRSTRSK